MQKVGVPTRISAFTGIPVQVTNFPIDPVGGLSNSDYLPRRAQLARENRRFAAVMGNGSTFLAPVTAIPTTTLTMALVNAEGGKGKDYVIERAWVFHTTGTATMGGMLLGCVTEEQNPVAPPAAYGSTVISSLSGRGTTRAIFANAVTLLGAQPAWFQLTQGNPSGTTFTTTGIVSQGGSGDIEGLALIRPGHMFGMAFYSGAGTTPLYGMGVIWSEVDQH